MEEKKKNPYLGDTTHDLVENAVDFIETNVKFEHGLPINENIVFHVLVRKKGRKINENLKALYGINSDIVAHAWQRVMEDAIALDKEIKADPDNQIVRTDIIDDTTKQHEADDYLAIMAECCVAVKKLRKELAEL